MNRWLVDALAVWRLTRLVAVDSISEPLRDWIAEWAETGPSSTTKEKIAELVGCPHCVSMWASLGLVYLVRRRRWWPAMADALALAAVSSLVADARDALEA